MEDDYGMIDGIIKQTVRRRTRPQKVKSPRKGAKKSSNHGQAQSLQKAEKAEGMLPSQKAQRRD